MILFDFSSQGGRRRARLIQRRGPPAFVDQELHPPSHEVAPRPRAGQHRPLERAAQHPRIIARLVGEQILRLRRHILGRCDDLERWKGLLGRGCRQPFARARQGIGGGAVDDHRDHGLVRGAILRVGRDAEEDHEAEQQQWRQQEQDEEAREDRGDEIAPSDHPGRFEQAHAASPRSASSISRAAASPAMATKASCRPGRSTDNSSMPAPPSISALSNGSMPPFGTSKCQ